jgi:hypothetical protein
MATSTTIKVQNFIDGERCDAVLGETEEILNPATQS